MSDQIKVELQETFGSDRSIAEAAWTSSMTIQSKGKRTAEDVERIVNMLANSGHSTPFESVIFRFWIKMPIQTDRQHVTHRICSHNGLSGRYRTMPDEWLEIPEDVKMILSNATSGVAIDHGYEKLCQETNAFYREALKTLKNAENSTSITNAEYKRAREFLRGVLPQNNMTERVTIINLRSFANYQKLRSSEHAQPEIRQVARFMLEQVTNSNVCPTAIKALQRNNWMI